MAPPRRDGDRPGARACLQIDLPRAALDWVVVVPVAFFAVYFNFFYQAQIGIRYFLVVFPPLYVLAGDLVGRLDEPLGLS